MNRRDALKTAVATIAGAALPAVAAPRISRALQDLKTHGGARLINGKWRLNPIVKWDYSWNQQRWIVAIFDGSTCICDCTSKSPCFAPDKTQDEAAKIVAELKRVWNHHCPDNPISLCSQNTQPS